MLSPEQQQILEVGFHIDVLLSSLISPPGRLSEVGMAPKLILVQRTDDTDVVFVFCRQG